jgi:hypothetical protein
MPRCLALPNIEKATCKRERSGSDLIRGDGFEEQVIFGDMELWWRCALGGWRASANPRSLPLYPARKRS